MKLSLKTALKWAGVNLNNPLSFLGKLISMIGPDVIQAQLEEFFSKRITAPRRVQLVNELRQMADHLEKQNNIAAARVLAKLLKEIKF